MMHAWLVQLAVENFYVVNFSSSFGMSKINHTKRFYTAVISVQLVVLNEILVIVN